MKLPDFLEKAKNNFKQAKNLLKLKFAAIFQNNKKQWIIFSIVLLLIAGGLILPGGSAKAEIGDNIAGVILGWVIYPLMYVIFSILFLIAYFVAWLGANTISVSLNPAIISAVLNHPSVYEGWKIFRDVANLLFILLLLLIALGTIFRSESYNIKKSLYKFILIIFLVNFSFMIAGLFIDFGNFLMYGVLKMMCPGGMGNNTCFQDFYRQMMDVIDNFWNNYYNLKTFLYVDAKAAIGMAVATIYTFIYGLVLMALGLFLMIRIAALAVLLVLAPLAFLGYTAPGLEGFKNKWWDNLIQYVMFGPVFALMLYVSGQMAKIVIDVPASAITVNPNLGNFGELFSTIIVNIIPLVFLIGIIPVTRAFGIAGSTAILGVTAVAGGALLIGAAKYAGGSIDRFMARGAADTRKGVRGTLRRGAAYLSPGAWKRAIKASRAEQEHDYDVATGKRKGTIDKMLAPYGTLKDKWQKKEPEIDPGQRVQERDAHRRWEEKNIKDPHEMINELSASLKQNDHYLAKEIAIAIAAENSTDDLLDKEMGNHTAKDFADYFKNNFGDALGTKQLAKMTSRIAEIEDKNGNNAYKGIGKYNDTANKWEYNDMSTPTLVQDQEKEVLGRWDSKDEFNRIKNLKKSAWFQKRVSPSGTPLPAGAPKEGLSAAGMKMFVGIRGKGLDQVKKMSPKIANAINDDLKFRYSTLGAPTYNAATHRWEAPAGTPPDIKPAWEQVMNDFDIH